MIDDQYLAAAQNFFTQQLKVCAPHCRDLEQHRTRMINRISTAGINGAPCLIKIDCISFRLHSHGLENLVNALLGSKSNGSVTTLKLSNNNVGDEGDASRAASPSSSRFF